MVGLCDGVAMASWLRDSSVPGGPQPPYSQFRTASGEAHTASLVMPVLEHFKLLRSIVDNAGQANPLLLKLVETFLSLITKSIVL